MTIPANILANADDFGYSLSVNKAILYCYQQKLINSSSLMVNTKSFDDAVEIIHQNSTIVRNIGVHVNLAEGKPITNFGENNFLDDNGNWDFAKVNQKFNFRLNAGEKRAFLSEINAQIEKVLSHNIALVHIDSHCHLHTLPCFFRLFIEASRQHRLKLRLAQTYSEGNYAKFYYRKYINNIFKKHNINYSDYFETPNSYINGRPGTNEKSMVEIMLHPEFNASGVLTDHFDADGFRKWTNFLEHLNRQ